VDNRRVSRGYVARNTVEVRVDDVDRVGEVLEIAVGSGATALGGIRFDLKDRGGLEREALRLAVADARAKADAAAAGVGQEVSRVLRIEEHAVLSGPPMQFMAAVREAPQSDTASISAGQMELHARVTMTVELK
jgi:uncharacterized protein YggE